MNYLIVGLVGFGIGWCAAKYSSRRGRSYSAVLGSYNCPTRTLTLSQDGGPTDPVLVLGHAQTSGGSSPGDPPGGCLIGVWNPGTADFSLTDAVNWPNTGIVDFYWWVVETADIGSGNGTTTCGSGSGHLMARGGGGGGHATMFRIAPRAYRVSFGPLLPSDEAWIREIGQSGPVQLTFDAGESHEQMSLWVSRKAGEYDCRLRVVRNGGSFPKAELSIGSLRNGASSSCTWTNDSWDFTGVNRLTASDRSAPTAVPQTIEVSPA